MATIFLTSCHEKLEVWDSETLDYSGTYFWQLYDENFTEPIEDYHHDIQLMIYNTSENIQNKVWIEDTNHVFPLKSKFTFTGDSKLFKSETQDFDEIENNEYAIETPTTKPTGIGETITEDRDYIRAIVLEGKILTDAATTISGNPVDSIYIKLKLLSGSVSFKSYELPEALRANPEEREFDWEYTHATYDSTNTADETYILSGHRKTGFVEDDH